MFDRIAQFLVDFAYLFRVIAVVHPYQRAVRLRLGTFVDVLEPGWHWVAPFRIDETIYEIVTPRTTDLPAQTLTTSDDVQASVAVLVTWEISDVAKLILRAAEHQEAMLDTTKGVLATAVMGVTWRDLQGDEFARTLRGDIKRKARKWGIKVLDVQLTECARTRTVRLLTPGTQQVHS